jgi:putative DNA primase/helicase
MQTQTVDGQTPPASGGEGTTQTVEATTSDASILLDRPLEVNPLLEAALDYAARGWRAFPCRPRDKKPLGTLVPHGCRDATTDEATIRRWWKHTPQANVGIACGDGVLVLDVDGAQGRASLRGLALPLTPTAETGGGLQYFFATPPGPVKNAVGLRPGLDVRTAGGYVVAPPSVHPSGTLYRWAEGRSPEEADLAPCPAWLTEALVERGGQRMAPPLPEVIREGQRNAALFSVAGSMRRRGADEKTILAALREMNASRCKPPLPEKELRRIVAGIGRYPPAAELDQAAVEAALGEYSDAGNAALIVALHGDRLRYDHPRQRWLVWKDHWWEEDTDGEVLRLALDAAEYRLEKACHLPPDKAKAAVKWALESRYHHRLVAALAVAKVLKPVAEAGEWDTDPPLLGVENGVVDLETGTLLEGSPDQRITRHVPLPFDPTAICPRWEQFVLEIAAGREDLAEFLRLAAGYSLTGEITEQVMFVCHGKGGTGKSTLLARLQEITGPYGRAAAFEAFGDPPDHPENLAVLAGARFVTASEVRENVRLNEQRLKVLSHGNDLLTARMLYGHSFSFRPVCKLWLSFNHRPRIQDDSTGFWRSVRLIPFDRTFTPEQEPTLLTTLQAELPGILAWGVRAARDWYASGLPKVAEVQSATDAWQREENPLGEWLESCCAEDEDLQTPGPDLWQSYLSWAEEQRLPVKERLSRRAFSNRLTGRFGRAEVVKITGKATRVYRGVGLQP